MTTPINIPTTTANAANAPSVDLSIYGPKRTFGYTVAPGTASVKVWGSGDGVNFPPITATPLLTLGGEGKSITIDDLSLRYRADPSVAGGVLTVDVQEDCCATGVSHFNTLPLGDFPTGGVVTTSLMVDQFGAFTIAQTTAGQTLTFPPPTDTSPTYIREISNVGTQSFVLYGIIVVPGSATQIVWNGSAWVENAPGTASPTFTVIGAGGISPGIIRSDGLTLTEIGNTDVAVPGNALNLYAGGGGGSWVIDRGGQMVLQTGGGGSITVNADASGLGGFQVGAGSAGVSVLSAGAIEFQPAIGSGVDLLPRLGAGNTTTLRFFELAINGANFVGLKAPDLLAGDTVYTLPAAFPTISNQKLTSTTGGVMSWRGATDVQAGNSSQQSIADGAAPAIVTGWTEVTDTAGAFDPVTGLFTAPATGFYWIAAQLEYAASVSILDGEFSVQVFVAGALRAIGESVSQVAVGASRHVAIIGIGLALTSGQVVDIRAAQNGGAGAVTLTNSTTRNLLSISQIT